jgi:hypothetical protein
MRLWCLNQSLIDNPWSKLIFAKGPVENPIRVEGFKTPGRMGRDRSKVERNLTRVS